MIGKQLGHYRVLEKIGEGGMGEVYLAEDTKLDRKVALKVLPPELAEDEDRRARFQREAKAIAALNHPNIVTVHSVEEVEGTHFITMERVNGKTLTEVIPKNGMPLDEFLELSIPLADAVASAHEEGIVHRDLKPAKVMVTDEGRVKVLDFGLAYQDAPIEAEVGRDSESPTELKTQEGLIAGTLHYMSPEQVEGKSVDARSDVFSLGILYYELLTGKGPFQGDTAASLISSILKDKPEPVTAFSPSLPRDIARIVRRCLVKDRTRRFQGARDVVNELRELQEELASGQLETPIVGTASRFRLPLWAGVATLALGLLAGYVVGHSRNATPSGSNFANPVQITSALGVEGDPTWSPDGGQLAYHSQQDGDFDIWIVQAGGGRPLNLTSDHEGVDRSPAWSPDGSRIAFRSDRNGGGYFVMPALGGPVRRVCPAGASLRNLAGDSELMSLAPAWSSDGTELACLIANESGVSVEIDTLETRNLRRIDLPASSGSALDLSWSPDGRFFAFVDAPPGPDVTRIVTVSAASGQGMPVTDGAFNDRSPSWSTNGNSLYYVSNRGGVMDLWQQRLNVDGTPTGTPERLTTGVGMTEAVYSPDRTKLAYSRGRPVSNIWRVPMLADRAATWADAEQITFEQARIQFTAMSPDGQHLLFSSDRGGNVDVWMLPMDGGDVVQLTTSLAPDWAPSWSPDGTEVVFYSYRSGNRDLWAMPVAGGAARQLTKTEASDLVPDWSPRGDLISFSTSRGGASEVWVMKADGSEPRRIGRGLGATWTHDGETLVLMHDDQSLWIHPIEGGAPRKLTGGPLGAKGVWSRDGKTLFSAGRNEREGNIWAVSSSDQTERKATDFVGRRGTLIPISLSTDGDYLYFAWRETLGDIWVMDVVTDED